MARLTTLRPPAAEPLPKPFAPVILLHKAAYAAMLGGSNRLRTDYGPITDMTAWPFLPFPTLVTVDFSCSHHRMRQRRRPVWANDARFQEVDAQIRKGEKYVDYLFKVLEQYVGSAKVFTGISGALLSLPFLKLDTLLKMAHTSEVKLFLLLGLLFLAVSVVAGGLYQLHAVQIVEDEVESKGKSYDYYVWCLIWEYRVMLSAMFIGAVLMVVSVARFAGAQNNGEAPKQCCCASSSASGGG
jgi:hypothetical protein